MEASRNTAKFAQHNGNKPQHNRNKWHHSYNPTKLAKQNANKPQNNVISTTQWKQATTQ